MIAVMMSCMVERITTLDIRRFADPQNPADRAAFVTELGQAYQQWGFAGICNHGIAKSEIDAAYRVFQAFFALPDEVKRKYHIPGGGGRAGIPRLGWKPPRARRILTSRSSGISGVSWMIPRPTVR